MPVTICAAQAICWAVAVVVASVLRECWLVQGCAWLRLAALEI